MYVLNTIAEIKFDSHELHELAYIIQQHLVHSIETHYYKFPKELFWEQKKKLFDMCVSFYELNGWGVGNAREYLTNQINDAFKKYKKGNPDE